MSQDKPNNSCANILYVLKILWEKTDEEHEISRSALEEELRKYGVEVERKAIYRYIQALNDFGIEIISSRGKNAGYSLASRQFELPELKLLADAVSSSRLLTQKQSDALLKKLGGQCSEHSADSLKRQVFVANRSTTDNVMIFCSINEIHRAIAEGVKIHFDYFKYNAKKNKNYTKGGHTCTPYALTWNDDNYYLLAKSDEYGHIIHFRVDRMEKVTLLDEKAEKWRETETLRNYLKSTFSMFSGEAETVTLRFTNDLVNPILDRFGKNVTLYTDGEEHFTIKVPIKTSAPMPFFSWLFLFGDKAEIVHPDTLRKAYVKALTATAIKNTKDGDNDEDGD